MLSNIKKNMDIINEQIGSLSREMETIKKSRGNPRTKKFTWMNLTEDWR